MKQFLIFIAIILSAFNLDAQEVVVQKDSTFITQKSFDKTALETYKNSNDFDYTVEVKEPNFLEKAWDWVKKMLIKFLTWILQDAKAAAGLLLIILKVLPYIIAALLLWFFIKMFLRVNVRNVIQGKNPSTKITFETEEELIHNKNLELLLQEAIAAKDFRQAVRYYYLFILQQLTSNEVISWQQEKTNEDYINEISQPNLKENFTKITKLYDFVWYGNFHINEVEFNKAEKVFTSIQTTIHV